ncbi:MAG: tetratricopeptide repeat protein [Planctomycetota bacterium]|jgi:tetratricopeptide (TPR) repeat protein
MTLVLMLVLLANPEEEVKRADALAAQADSLEGEERARAVDRALEAYRSILDRHPKDRRLIPRLRRRRATLLRREGRAKEAIAEHDAILRGRARRKDKARALYDGAILLERAGDFDGAEQRLRRALEEYPDITGTRAKASLARGRVLEAIGRPKEAKRAYRYVVERCWDEAKEAISAYDALALLAIREGRLDQARRWLKACTARYEKRASREDRYGGFLSRRLGAMKAPRELAALRKPKGG